MKAHMLAALAAMFLVTACQATSRYAGNVPVHLPVGTANAIEAYLADADGEAMAMSRSGGYWRTSSCRADRCSYTYGDAETNAVTLCSQHARQDCFIFAVKNQVVWQGNVYLPTPPNGPAEGRFDLRLTERLSGTSSRTWNGRASPKIGGGGFSLRVQYKKQNCEGLANPSAKVWGVECEGLDPIRGRLETRADGTFWGIANDKDIQISFSRRTWPLLRAALTKKPGFDASFQPVSTKPAAEPKLRRRTAAKPVYPKPLPGAGAVALDWPGVSPDLKGMLELEGQSKDGILRFEGPDGAVACEGKVEVWYGTTGHWNLDCGDQGRGSGRLRISDGLVHGTGATRDNQAVRFLVRR